MNAITKRLMALALLAGPVAANAGPVTYYFTGVVTTVHGSYSSVALGTPVKGTYIIDFANASETLGIFGSTSSVWEAQTFGGSLFDTPLPNGFVFFSSVNGTGFS